MRNEFLDMIFEYEHLIVYDQHADKVLSLVWDALEKDGFLVTGFYQDKHYDNFCLFSKDTSRVLVRKSEFPNALFLYIGKTSDAKHFFHLTEQCPLCASKQIETWVSAAYDSWGIPAPSSHCGACKIRWHDSKVFKRFWENIGDM